MISRQGHDLVFRWKSSPPVARLETAVSLTNLWEPVRQLPVLVNGEFVLTNSINPSAPQQFFRLTTSTNVP
jgi:hypothetical protein